MKVYIIICLCVCTHIIICINVCIVVCLYIIVLKYDSIGYKQVYMYPMLSYLIIGLGITQTCYQRVR